MWQITVHFISHLTTSKIAEDEKWIRIVNSLNKMNREPLSRFIFTQEKWNSLWLKREEQLDPRTQPIFKKYITEIAPLQMGAMFWARNSKFVKQKFPVITEKIFQNATDIATAYGAKFLAISPMNIIQKPAVVKSKNSNEMQCNAEISGGSFCLL